MKRSTYIMFALTAAFILGFAAICLLIKCTATERPEWEWRDRIISGTVYTVPLPEFSHVTIDCSFPEKYIIEYGEGGEPYLSGEFDIRFVADSACVEPRISVPDNVVDSVKVTEIDGIAHINLVIEPGFYKTDNNSASITIRVPAKFREIFEVKNEINFPDFQFIGFDVREFNLDGKWSNDLNLLSCNASVMNISGFYDINCIDTQIDLLNVRSLNLCDIEAIGSSQIGHSVLSGYDVTYKLNYNDNISVRPDEGSEINLQIKYKN